MIYSTVLLALPLIALVVPPLLLSMSRFRFLLLCFNLLWDTISELRLHVLARICVDMWTCYMMFVYLISINHQPLATRTRCRWMDVPGSRRMISNWPKGQRRVSRLPPQNCKSQPQTHNPSQPSHATKNVRLQSAVICDHKLRKAQSEWVGTRERSIKPQARSKQVGQGR